MASCRAIKSRIASRFSCEIVSADSMQVYRYMDIGTAKATAEERRLVRHHLIDIVDPDEPYDAARFVQDCGRAVEEIRGRGRRCLVTGGTGLYLQALLYGLFEAPRIRPAVRERLRRRAEEEGIVSLHGELAAVDPESAARIHPRDRQRVLRGLEIYLSTGIPWSAHLQRQRSEGWKGPVRYIVLYRQRQSLYERIGRRAEQMVRQGLLEEVQELLDRGYAPGLPALQAIGYRHALAVLRGGLRVEEMIELLARDTRRYAKRQLTWFRREPRALWLPVTETDRVLEQVDRFFSREAGAGGGDGR